jgi:hypothetical protein
MPVVQVSALLLRQHLLDLLGGAMTLPAFDEWLTEATWDESNIAADAIGLAGHVGLLIDEYSSGAWTWPELRDRLRDAATSASVAWGDAPVPHVTTGAASPFIRELVLATQA